MTSPGRQKPPQARQGAVLANAVEGYLLVQAEQEQARQEAEVLCRRLAWLTREQAEDLALHYTEQRLGLTQQALQATADRAKRLRGEYEARYVALRRALLKRHAVWACFLLVCSITASAAAHLSR